MGCYVDQRRDVVVVEPVVDDASVSLARDEPERAQTAQLVTDGRLAHAERGGEIAGAERPGLKDGEQAKPRRIAECGEQSAGTTERARGTGQVGARRLDGIGVDAADGTGVYG